MYAMNTNCYFAGSFSHNHTASETQRVIPILGMEEPTFGVNDISTYPIINEIEKLKNWGENWDGRGAVAINEIAITNAATLVSEMYRICKSEYIGWTKPNVTGSPFGEVVLEWWNNEKKLTMYFGEDASDYLKIWGPDIDHNMEDGSLDPATGAQLLSWLGG